MVETTQPSALAKCDRCAVQLRVAESRREDSRPFRKAAVPEGLCPDCVMTEFLYNTYPVNMIINERGPEMLLNAESMRMALLSSGVMDPAHCEMDVNEINWRRVVDNWNLPVKLSKSGRNPYRMGDAKKRLPHAAEMFPDEDTARKEDPVSADEIDIPDDFGPIHRKRKPQ